MSQPSAPPKANPIKRATKPVIELSICPPLSGAGLASAERQFSHGLRGSRRATSPAPLLSPYSANRSSRLRVLPHHRLTSKRFHTLATDSAILCQQEWCGRSNTNGTGWPTLSGAVEPRSCQVTRSLPVRYRNVFETAWHMVLHLVPYY